jgi:hypothetical protein
MKIVWDNTVTRVEQPALLCCVRTGQTQAFRNACTFLSFFHAQEYHTRISPAVMAWLTDYSQRGSSVQPGQAESDTFTLTTPQGSTTLVVVSVLPLTGARRASQRLAEFKTVVGFARERQKIIRACGAEQETAACMTWND